jgi:hypothetical protein
MVCSFIGHPFPDCFNLLFIITLKPFWSNFEPVREAGASAPKVHEACEAGRRLIPLLNYFA